VAHPNEELARREMDLLTKGDLDGALDLYAEDVVFHYPGGFEPHRPRKAERLGGLSAFLRMDPV
jgi:ketosteroid isomerase-like protein